MAQTAQTYETHRHNPKPTAIAGLLCLASIVLLGLAWLGYNTLYLGLLLLAFSVMVLVAISRLYITKLQDRMIKMEMRARFERLLTPAQLATVAGLRAPQLIALRFASDGELPGLVDRAQRENLTADQIKRAITTWVPDWDRT